MLSPQSLDHRPRIDAVMLGPLAPQHMHSVSSGSVVRGAERDGLLIGYALPQPSRAIVVRLNA